MVLNDWSHGKDFSTTRFVVSGLSGPILSTFPAHTCCMRQTLTRAPPPLGSATGKSTLLRALAVGVYDKVPGDGRELAVTDPGAVTVRAEDGRPVSGVDISPFISSLPSAAATAADGSAAGVAATKGTATDVSGATTCTTALGQGAEAAGGGGGESSEQAMTTERFSTGGASGSTSQAANVVEALEAGATGLLLDEDTCAGNVSWERRRGAGVAKENMISPNCSVVERGKYNCAL